MAKETFNVEVTFRHIGSATVTGLDQQQAWQVADVLRLIEQKPPRYAENGVLMYSVRTETADRRRCVTREGGFLTRLMRRFNAWMMGGCVIVSMLAGQVFAQESKARAMEPARVQIATQGETPYDQELNRLVRAELQKTRIVIVSRRARTAIHLAVAEITSKGQRTGFASALLMLDGGDVAYLSVFIESDLPALARRMADFLKQELATKRER